MKRFTHLTLALGTVALLALLLFLAMGAQPAARADGNTIKVPDDYPTIQAAIDAAADGDTILVAAGIYTENLSITEGITLTGGWDPTFSTRQLGDSTINGNFQGRVISITCATNDTVVTVDGFTVQNGDASGFDAPFVAAHSTETLPPNRSNETRQPSSDLRSPSAQVAELRAQLIALGRQGLYPGGENALRAMLDRLEQRTQQAVEAKARADASSVRSQGLSQQGPGAGGGVYSWNASPHLLNNVIQYNVATRVGRGLGGGIFVGQTSVSGVVIANNLIEFNSASEDGEGRGGGLHLAQAPGAHVVDNSIGANVASTYGNGFGGGAYVHQSPGILVEDNWLFGNAAADADGLSRYSGVGGGLMVYDSQDAVVRGNQVERNTANAAWYSYDGAGGGLFLTVVNGAVITDNLLRDNLAALDGGAGGGGLQLQWTANALVADNEVIGNWAGMFVPPGEMGGGGISLADVYSSTVRGNMITGNTSSVVGGINVLGGGLYGIKLGANTQIISNVITANVACHARCWFGGGGGVFVGDSHEVEVADNTIENNMASLLDAPGSAGGIMMRNTSESLVSGNRIQHNQGGISVQSSGGGLVWDSFFGWSENVVVDGNLILDNQASSDPSDSTGGGGFLFWALRGDVQFINNVVAGNQGSGARMSDLFNGAALVNNTIVDNGDIGLFVAPGISTTITFTNNIVVSHTVGISVTEGSTATVSYTLWDGNDTDIGGSGTTTHTHPVTGDPAFVAPSDHDYHLTIGSAARDAGDPVGVPPAPDHDRDGVARPQGMAVDIGAYEWLGHYQYLPLVAQSFDPRTGWAIGQDASGTAAIVHTADGGLTWQVQGDSAAWTGLEPGDVSAVDDQTAWVALTGAVGETDGAILHTTDGGVTWVSQTIPTGLAGGIKGIKGLSRDEAWAASLGGTVLHTTDGGDTWNIAPHPTAPITQVNRMDAMGTDVWIADASNTGSVVHSTDSGVSWRVEPLPDQDSALTVNAFSPTAVWATGSLLQHNPTLYRTKNGGDQWDKVKTIGAGDHLDDVCAADADNAWGAQNGDESDGRIWRVHVTPDGTPEAQDVTPTELDGYPPGGVTCLDTQVAWVAATVNIPNIPDPNAPRGYILHTTDGGESWVRQAAPTDIKYWKISMVGARR